MVKLDGAHHCTITSLLDEVLPASHVRPGSAGVRAWYGILDGDQLVACGADRSGSEAGLLAAIAVSMQHQGRGLGAALTAAMTRRLFAEYDVVALGVMWDNDRATRRYQRLGFAASMARTSVSVSPVQSVSPV